MSVITQVKRDSKKVLPGPHIQAIAEYPSEPVSAPVPVVESRDINSLKAELLALEKSPREQLLQQLFADDLAAIVTMAQQEGLAAGQEEIQQLQTDFADRQQVLIEQLNDCIKTFGEQTPQVDIKDEKLLVEIIYQAVLKIIDVQLGDPDYVKKLIQQLGEEMAGQQPLQLHLGQRDFALLSELQLQVLLPSNITVIEEVGLLPGSYRMDIEGGVIESILEDKLKTFTKLMIQTGEQTVQTS